MDSLQARLEEEDQLELEADEEQRRAERIERRRIEATLPLDTPTPKQSAPVPLTRHIVEGIAPNQIDRFWSRVDRCGDCWEWQGPPNRSGYGQVSINRKMYPTHRLAYMLTKGPIPRGMFVRHACDNRLCVRPDHLDIGTFEDNIADTVRRKRGGPGENAARGERAGSSRLTDRDVIQIREAYAAGGVTQTILARDFGVDTGTISRIVTGKAWTHLPITPTSQTSGHKMPRIDRMRRSVYKVVPSPGLAKRSKPEGTA